MRSQSVLFLSILLVRTQVQSSSQDACTDPLWLKLHETLDDAFHNTAYREVVVPGFMELTANLNWYKTNYQDCVEGMLSLVLYLSLHDTDRSAALVELASETARELNPLALQSGFSSWPFFDRLGDLHLIWQAGSRAEPLSTAPLRAGPFCGANSDCGQASALAVVSPMLFSMRTEGLSPMTLVERLTPGALLIDAGVFDGTDWSLLGTLTGVTVLGFEPMRKNRALFENRYPPALSDALQQRQCGLKEATRTYTLIDVAPGDAMPRKPWTSIFPSLPVLCGEGTDEKQLGHAFLVGAALGERALALNMTTRYDYSSIADQGYLAGPKDMVQEEIAMVSLDDIFWGYLTLRDRGAYGSIDVLKLDVEGYEMGALRGAERLLSEGRVHFIVLEFHPGMLGTTGTDPVGMLTFLSHYCFLCHSQKIDRPYPFDEFVARYTSTKDATPLQGLGKLEDLTCQYLWWRPQAPLVVAPT